MNLLIPSISVHIISINTTNVKNMHLHYHSSTVNMLSDHYVAIYYNMYLV